MLIVVQAGYKSDDTITHITHFQGLGIIASQHILQRSLGQTHSYYPLQSHSPLYINKTTCPYRTYMRSSQKYIQHKSSK